MEDSWVIGTDYTYVFKHPQVGDYIVLHDGTDAVIEEVLKYKVKVRIAPDAWGFVYNENLGDWTGSFWVAEPIYRQRLSLGYWRDKRSIGV